MVVIDQRGARLGYHAGALELRFADGGLQHIPLHLIDQLVLAASIRIDSTVLTHLSEQGVSLVAMPGRGARRSAFVYGSGHGDAGRRLGQYALVTDPAARQYWAGRFVAGKLLGGRRLLRRAAGERPDCRHALVIGTTALQAAREKARDRPPIDTLLGIEGNASARFFAAYRTLFAASLGFESRNRRPPRDPVNAALSLGYTLAHGEAVRAIAGAGLDPMLGMLHDIAYHRESLACDFVEMARPRIELLAWRLFATQALPADQFHQDGSAARMGKAARRTFFASYERHAAIHRGWFDRYARIMANACSERYRQSRHEGA